MNAWSSLLLVHLIGLALAVGAATVKLVLVFVCRRQPALLPVFATVGRPVTRLIVLGMVLLTLSGLGWLLLGHASFTPLLALKMALVIGIFALGPYIDNAVEPKLARLIPGPGQPAPAELGRVQRLHAALEVVATALLYVVTVAGVLV